MQLGGITVPSPEPRIHRLYPTFDAYQREMAAATDVAVRRGWLLPIDAIDQMRRACAVQRRYPKADRGTCERYSPPAFATS